MLERRCWHVFIFLTLPFQGVLGLVAQLPNNIALSSQPSLRAIPSSSANGTYLGVSPDAPLAFKVEYRYKAYGTSFKRIAFLNTMILGVGAMAKWSWNARTTTATGLPSPYGISMRFIPARAGPGLATKYIAWTIEEIFDILVEHDRYSVGNFLVNSNWDEDRVAIGSLSVVAPPLAIGKMTGIASINRLESSSSVVSVVRIPDDGNFNSQLSVVNQSASIKAGVDMDFITIYPPGGAVFHDVQFYNATLKNLIKVAAEPPTSGYIWPMIATYNDMENFTLSVRSWGTVQGSQLTWAQAGKALIWFPQSVLHWREQSVLINVDGKPTGIICIDKGDRTNFFSSIRCQPELPRNLESEVAAIMA